MNVVSNFGLTEEQLVLRDSVQRFVQKELPEDYVRHCDQEKIVPLEKFDKIAEMGWLGLPNTSARAV